MTYKALTMLEKHYPPLLHNRPPYWQPKPPPITQNVVVPQWRWTSPDRERSAPGRIWVTLDANAAYLSAASSANFAHGALEQVSPLDVGGGNYEDHYRKMPGFYLVDYHPWPLTAVPSPLGGIEDTWPVWLAHPTVEQLEKLSRSGHWPEVVIRDAWVSPTSCRLRKWTDAVKAARAEILNRLQMYPEDAALATKYEAIKTGYSVAVQMMLTPPDPKGTPEDERRKKNRTYRPDWWYTIYAQHRATLWRKAWNCLWAGHPPVAIGNVDEITFCIEDFEAVTLSVPGEKQRPPIRIDRSGISLGTFKEKSVTTVEETNQEGRTDD